MDKAEFAKFYTYITSVATDTKPSPQRMEVYWDLLNDLDFTIAMLAAKKVLATLENPFLPMPAVFRSEAARITGPRHLTAPEAYTEALRAVRNFGGYREQEALESLSLLTRKAVESIGFKNLCYSEEPGVLAGQFRMNYEALAKREEIDAKTPIILKELIERASPALKLAEKPEVPKVEAPKVDLPSDEEVRQIRERMAKIAKLRKVEG